LLTRKESDQSTGEPITISALKTKERGRPLLLGAELDAAVQEHIQSFRLANGVVNTIVVMAAEGIISAKAQFSWRTHCYYQKLG